MRFYKLFFLLSFLFTLLFTTSCATKVSSIKQDRDLISSPEEGYLLIAVDTNVDLNSIDIDGEKDIILTEKDLISGSNYILVNLPAGDYVIETVRTSKYVRFELDDDIWEFQVKPGVVTYVGHLEVKTKIWGFLAFFELINKSSFALEYMEENFPEILAGRDMEYGGKGEERFFQTVRGNKGLK